MTQPIRNRSRLLLGCGSTALALALAMAPQDAQAQGIQATGNVVFGSAQIDNSVPSQTTVNSFSQTVVINWTPNQDGNGNALTFLPNNATALFQTTAFPDFAVLNRILPAPNGNIAEINGAVISRFQNAAGGPATPAGFVAFYSPTGLLIGNTATFDVGKLLLTTLNTTDTDFQNFAEFGGNMTLTAGTTAQIQIRPGANIIASPENAFFAVVAADVEMFGTARINGSHAYVAGDVVNLQYSNGLFNISIPVGTSAAGEVMTLNGNIGGQSSTGAGDNHMIYAVARGRVDPISMLFSGNLGFDPAQSAGVVNGEIILSANHNVFGRNVNGGSVSEGISGIFGANAGFTDTIADVFLTDFSASSSLLAIGTNNVTARANNAAISAAGNLMLVAQNRAELFASANRTITIGGDLLVSAQDYGVVSSSLQSLAQINAFGGVALVQAQTGGTINVGGNARVTADAFAGADDLNRIAGIARGGTAQVWANGGAINITGSTSVSANAFGAPINDIITGAESRAGTAEIIADFGGDITIGLDAEVFASAFGAQGSLSSPSSVSNAYGGFAAMRLQNAGSSLTIGGNSRIMANARGGSSNNSGAGSIGDAGVAVANVNDAGLIRITGGLLIESEGSGGSNAGGIGGLGLGGRASAFVPSGGTFEIGSDFNAFAAGNGGNGVNGGDGFGGIAGANVVTGSFAIGGNAVASSMGFGGGAFFGFGGNGGLGRGGNSFFQANGTLTQTATLSILGYAYAFSEGYGGVGGSTDGDGLPGGRGGDGYGGQFNVPNQADPAFGSGAYILAGGDNGRINVGGLAWTSAVGVGGQGGSGQGAQPPGTPIPGGRGGDGFGGLAQSGFALFGQNGSVGLGQANFANVRNDATAFGGRGGLVGDFPGAPGGNATGGNAFLTVRAGDVIANQIVLTASGVGGEGTSGGFGRGGQAATLGSLGGTLTASSLEFTAIGFGGVALSGTGGEGFGGLAAIQGDGMTVTVNGDVFLKAVGSGGNSEDGAGGNATGGQAYVATLTGNNPGAITITGHAQVLANGQGGNSITNFAGGNGTGGTAYIEANGGSAVNIGSAQVHAVGRGGTAQVHQGGNGTGGTARIEATGTNSRVTIQRLVPIAFNNTSGGFAIINANGIGEITRGGTGIGGTGRGGIAEVTAIAGGTVALSTDNSQAINNAVFARGFGGNSIVEGGAGGDAFGGTVTLLADGGTINAGAATPSTFSQAGASGDATRNISGGNASGGSRNIRVINGGQLTIENFGGGAGAQAGNGSGTGNGGNAIAGDVLFEVINSTVNLIGGAPVFNNANGGNGQIGGNVSGGTITFNAVGSIINLLPNAAGATALGINNEVQGGNGVTAGGSAQGSLVLVTVDGTQITGGSFGTRLTATGGNALAANGVGGNATGATLAANFIDSTLNFSGEVLLAADAAGGNGGVTGVGGSATTGDVDIVLTRTTMAIASTAQGAPGILRVRAQAKGGQGGTVGNATSRRALLNLVDSTLSATSVYVESRAFSEIFGAGQLGGTATSQQARIGLTGTSGITANLLELNASAATSQGGSATAGFASLQAEASSTATITAPQINLLADASSTADNTAGIAGATQGGQALLASNGGNLTLNGNVLASARGIGATSSNLLSGATSRGGVAQLFTRLGGTVTLNGNINLDASAVGATGSLVNASSASNAFGGTAIINVGDTGGSLIIRGDATANANAIGGSSNNAGAGSLADAGTAVANVTNTGLIEITGRLRLDAQARGGENAGGTGGLALGGRASTATFSNGTIRIGSFNADTLAQGGNGRIGGNGVAGIAGAIATFGEVAITGNAFAGSEGIGGSATYGVGGAGGFGRGGNSFFQANGDLTRTARITIGGNAIAFAQGVGGNGGNGDSVTAGGAGGAGLGGGQGNVPNQADPAFGSGAFLLAGGDNGTIEIGGEAVAVATAAGGRGGNGGTGTAGGNGGNALSGLAQAGLALLGANGSVGLGVARFNTVFAQTDAFAGNGGTATDPAQSGAGGIGIAGTSALTARAGDVFANDVELSAIGYGGNGSTGGNGTGGFAGVFGSLAGSLNLGALEIISQGYGGNSTGAGVGGTGTGGEAFLNYSLMDTTITGDVLIDASGFGGTSVSGRGGDGIGRNARVGTLGTGAGNGTIGGNTRVLANGTGGAGATAGSGDGGLAEAQAFNGGTSNFASLLLSANGRFGEAGAGITALRTANGSTSTLNATSVQMTANATDGTTNFAGQFLVNAESGNINLGSLTASSLGNALNVDLSSSRLLAEFGNINVTGALTATTYGDMLLRIGTNSVIGNTATTGNNTNIQLDASGTIRLLAVAPPSGPGGANEPIGTGGIVGRNITMRAGRSILLDGNLTSRSGAVSLAANLGGGPALATPQPSVITMGSGFTIHAGTGQVAINLADGAGDPQRATGAITLANVTGGSIAVDNRGSSAGSNIVVLSNGVLTASGTGRAIDLASFNGEVINFANDAGLVLTGGGHFGIFAATPTGSQIGNPANYVRRYNVQTEVAYDALNPGGNFAAFRIAPVITVTADNATRFYGSANPLFTASFAGFLPGDGIYGISGAASLTTTATGTSNVGTFAIAAALGTLVSAEGYQFAFAPGVLTITARPITVTANNLSRLYGNANPALTFTVGGQGLVNGDQLTGALATTATATTGVGTVAITQGTLAATNNYILTFVNGQLSITPRLLTVTANNQSILLGQPDPELTYTLTGDGLVNGDLLGGVLVRDEGNAIGSYAIRQGTLSAGSNYTINYVGATFEINAPPAPPVVNNPTIIDTPFLSSEEPPMTSEEEEERFGMDFPERPDAPLITQESLLDDPVSSGGDASLYSGDANAAPGGGEKK